jgi:hypothetical protein
VESSCSRMMAELKKVKTTSFGMYRFFSEALAVVNIEYVHNIRCSINISIRIIEGSVIFIHLN